MRILMVASEATPLAKTGGLADVVGSLPAALARLGCDVTLVIPGYREALTSDASIEPTGIEFDVPLGQRLVRARVLRYRQSKSHVRIMLIEQSDYFDRPTLYGGQDDYQDNAERFIFFCRAVLEFAVREDQPYDIVHCHDWQTGLIPAYLKTLHSPSTVFSNARSVLTIHNMAYQGMFWYWDMLLTGLHWKYFNWQQMEFYGQLNLLKTGLVFADAISTVSPSYATEIQHAPGGCSLEGVVASRKDSLTGIVNGIDLSIWDPRNDSQLPRFYSDADYQDGKYAARVALATRFGHAAPDSRPLVAFVGRFAQQKGVDLIAELLTRQAGSGRAHYSIMGTGDRGIESQLRSVANAFPGTIDLFIGFDERMAHLVQAAADIMLVPSRYEPCGLTQLHAFRYGTIPVVRATGGLIDTVVDTTPETLRIGSASGFVFDSVESSSLEHALSRALDAHSNRTLWADLVRLVMAQDWSWDRSAAEYHSLFEKTLSRPPVSVALIDG